MIYYSMKMINMANKNYIAGRNFEYKVKKYYESKGFTVLRTSGSHGFADLIAVRNFQIYLSKVYFIKTIEFIQCKNRKPLNKEVEDLGKFRWLERKVWDEDTLLETKITMVYPEKLKDMKENIVYD